MLKILFIILGTISLIIGIIGIFIPGLPTTPFLLLTAGLYLRGSEKLHKMLISNKYLGKYIIDFQNKKGMSRQLKIYSIFLMWFMISISCIFFIKSLPIKILIINIGIVGTVVMGFIVPTIDE